LDDRYRCEKFQQLITLQGTNISPKNGIFEDDFPFPKVGYVNSLGGISINKGGRGGMIFGSLFVVSFRLQEPLPPKRDTHFVKKQIPWHSGRVSFVSMAHSYFGS